MQNFSGLSGLGNTYSPANLFEYETYGEYYWDNHGYKEDKKAFAEYFTGKEYSKLTGKIAVSDKMEDDVTGKIVILGDEKELAQYDISKKTEPISVDVNLSGVSWLRIELRFYSDEKSGRVYTLLSDFELYK